MLNTRPGRHVLAMIAAAYFLAVFFSPQGISYQRKADSLLGVPSHVFGDGFYHHLLAKSIAEKGVLYVAEKPADVLEYTKLRGGFSLGKDGMVYITALPGISLLAAPFYRVFGIPGYYLLNALLGVVTCWFVYRTCRLHVNEDAAAKTTLFFGLGTIIFTYSQYFYSDILSCALLAGSFYHLLRGQPVISGLLAGLLLITKAPLALAAVVFCTYLFSKGGWRKHAFFAAGFALTAWTFFAYNILCFGGPFATGYGSELHVVDGVQNAINVNSLDYWGKNPLKTVPLYTLVLVLTNPLLIVSAAGLRRWGDVERVLAALFIVFALVYGVRSDGIGGWCWSWRFMLPMTALAALPAAKAVEERLVPDRWIWALFYLSVYLCLLSLAPVGWHIQTNLVDAALGFLG